MTASNQYRGRARPAANAPEPSIVTQSRPANWRRIAIQLFNRLANYGGHTCPDLDKSEHDTDSCPFCRDTAACRTFQAFVAQKPSVPASDRQKWEQVADMLASRMMYQANHCPGHPGSTPDCPFCQDTVAYQAYLAAGGTRRLPEFTGTSIDIFDIVNRPER